MRVRQQTDSNRSAYFEMGINNQESNLRNNKQTNGNRDQNNESPPPPPPAQSQNVEIHSLSLTYNPNVLEAKTKSVTAVIQETTNAIFEKTGCKAIFYPTSKIRPSPLPIENIITDFPPTPAKLKDFFQVLKPTMDYK